MSQPFLPSWNLLKALAVHLHSVHIECWHYVSVLQVSFEQFKDALILVLSSNEETLAKESPTRPGSIILCLSLITIYLFLINTKWLSLAVLLKCPVYVAV